MIEHFKGAPFKRIITIDFETRWSSKDYTLSKMTTEEYIRDPRFKAFGAVLHEIGGDTAISQWYTGEELHRVLKTYDWNTTAILAHNAQFDVSILEWVYDTHPCFIFDTLSMARALRGVEVGNSLAKLTDTYGLPPKGRAVHSTDGLEELTPAIEKELAEYCKHDVFLCEEIFGFMLLRVDPVTRQSAGLYPLKELRLIDMTIKMYTRPQLQLDGAMLAEAIGDEREKREGLLQRLNVTDSMLASNDHFATVLQGMGVAPPTKISRTSGKPIWAFAKNDAKFQALLDGDNEEVSALCEARLKVKSTTERTRAQRFLDISQRGALPVPLSYYGAATGRWAASKGSAINMQNLKRGSFLRKSILAPEGHVLVVGDLSQIEPRVLAWLADYDDLLNIFRSGQDAYAMFGRQMFNNPTLSKDSEPGLRQSAKSALLGCFGADTPVLTQRGWVPIVQVQATDTVWDGEAWVTHQGLVPQGEKEVLTALGISATLDHEILTGRGWEGWSGVLADPSLLTSALSLANLPASPGSDKHTPTGPAYTSHECAVLAAGKALFTGATSSMAAPHAVIAVPNAPLSRPVGNNRGTTPYAQTGRTETGFWGASAPSSFGAPTPTAASTRTMGAAVSRCVRSGWKTVSSFFGTLSASMVGISPTYSLIGVTTAVATSRAICALSHAASTWPTSARSKHATLKNSSDASRPLRQRMQTYDIAYAGPRNRFTILTDEGPLVVHNCGYQLGWASFAQQLLTGFLGAPPMRYDKTFAKKLGVTPEWAEKFLGWNVNVEQLEKIQANCTPRELVVHCLAAARIIEIYRDTAAPIKAFWALLDSLIERSLYGGDEYDYKGVLLFRKEEIVLPSGMSLRYPDLKRGKDEKGRLQWTYGPDDTKLYAGKITNNCTQGVARVVMTDGMLRVAKRYFVAGTVHDEQIDIVPEQEAAEAQTWVLEQMTKTPSYLPGIPLSAEVGAHRRYGLAKG